MKTIKNIYIPLLVVSLFVFQFKVAYAIQGKVVLLDDDMYTQAIETNDGRVFEMGAIAQYKDTDKGREILTELEIDKEKKKVNKVKGSYEIADNNQLKQVALIQKIADGRVLPRRDFRPDRIVIGLIFYRIGDTATYCGKNLTLDRFEKEKALWKGSDGKTYTIHVVEKKGKAEYALNRFRP